MNELIFIYLIAWFISVFEPLQYIIDYIFIDIPDRYNFNVDYKVIDWIYTGLGCWKCLSFWIALGFTGSLYLALLLSFVAWISEKLLNEKK